MAQNNTVTLIGNMGGEAQIFEDKNGNLFAAFSLATRDSYKDKNDEWQQTATTWHSVLTFQPDLVQLASDFKTGARIEVSGSLSYREFVKQVNKKKVTKREASVIARKIIPAPLAKRSKTSPAPAPSAAPGE